MLNAVALSIIGLRSDWNGFHYFHYLNFTGTMIKGQMTDQARALVNG